VGRAGLAILSLAMLASCGIPGQPQPGDVPAADGGYDPFEPPDNYVPGDGDAPGFIITSVDPARGPIAGGTRVTVGGTGFLPGSTVVFGASLGLEVVVQNEGTIAATTPGHPAGPVSVTVQRPDGKWTRLDDAFFYETDIGVDRVEPGAGPTAGGTPITVRGRGFNPDTVLVVGGRLALLAHVIDPSTIIAVTPPGSEGPRDVLVLNAMGSAQLKKGFRYAARPAPVACSPGLVPASGGTAVTVTGSGLTDAVAVTAAPGHATIAGPATGSSLPIRVEPSGPGPVAVTVATPGGEATVSPCVYAGSPDDLAATSTRVLAVVPGFGTDAGGYEARVVVAGLGATYPAEVTARLGGAIAEILAVSASDGTVVVRVPPHEAGVVDCEVYGPGGADVAAGAFEYVPEVTLQSISPSSGPASGGTAVTLHGTHLERVREVRVGPLPASITGPASLTLLDAMTGPASPGAHDVAVVTDRGERVVLPRAFTFGAVEPAIVAVTPNAGSQAGGTVVALVGSGFQPGCAVRFGSSEGHVLDAGDPARIVARTPAGAPGTVDVTVRWPDGATRRIERAFTYFDPTGYFGGVWGDVVDGAVNVTVLDSYNGKPVFGAFVILGSDMATPYQGKTDLLGQITLSGEDLFGPVQATATRSDYATFTLAGVDAENLTLFIDPIIPTSSGGGGGNPTHLNPGTIAGRVLGVDKYVLAPPATCADRPLVDGVNCRPCATDGDCAPDGLCLGVAPGGRHCAAPCQSAVDCPERYDCFGVTGGVSACLPSVGASEVRCGTTATGMFSTAIDAGPGALVGPDHLYALNSRLGDVAVWCVGGVRRFDDGEFEPLVLGLVRHVPVYAATLTADRDVYLDIPLDRELDVRLANAPGGPDGPNVHTLLLVVDLGSDGLLRLWPQATGLDRDHFVVRRLPRTFDGPLADANVDIYAEANSQTTDTIPYSASIERDWVPGAGNRVLEVGQSMAVVLDPDVRPDAVGGCGLPGGGGIVLAPGGRAFAVGAAGAVSGMPSLSTRTLRACAAGPGGQVLAVGDDGVVVRWDGAVATPEDAPSSSRLLAVAWAQDGSGYAAGEGALLRRSAGGAWTRLDYGSMAPLRALALAPDGSSALAVGDGGLALVIGGEEVGVVSPWPTDADLLAAAPYGPGAVTTGSRGVAFVATFDGGFVALPAPVDADLRVAAAMADGSVLAAGSNGTFARLADGAWTVVPAPSFKGEVTTLLPGPAGGAIAVSADAVTVGPFLAVTRFLRPWRNLPWTDLTLEWTRDGPPDPSLSYTRLTGQKGGGDWTIVAPGAVHLIALPDLKLAGLTGLDAGPVRLRATHFLIDHFDMGTFDETVYSSDTWRSWTVQQFVTEKM
jgi:hypothetical protein